MAERTRWWSWSLLVLVASLSAALDCKHNDGDSVVVTGEGARLSSETIDNDPMALLPANPIAVSWVDAQAFFASPFGAELSRIAAQRLPIGAEAGFVAQRDLKKLVGGVYSFAGADAVAVAQGDFDPVKIGAAADAHATTPVGVPLVHSRYAGNDVYTAGNVGFTVVTRHTMLIGNETGMRRALDRIRDNRLKREVPEWMAKLIETPQAALVCAGDVEGQPQVANVARLAPFLNGLRNFRVLGNFQSPGLNLAGSLAYPDAASAAAGASSLRSLTQPSTLTALLALLGLGSPLRDVQISTQDKETTFVAGLDAQSLTRLLSQLM
jgi:hypothetical protein